MEDDDAHFEMELDDEVPGAAPEDTEQANEPTIPAAGPGDQDSACPAEAPAKKMAGIRQNYRHLRTIRQSIYGKIKYGEHRTTGEKVAVKICSLVLIARWRTAHEAAVQEGRPWNECRIEDPYSEANMMRVLAEPGHPNVVTLTEVIQDPENLYIVMEFANG